MIMNGIKEISTKFSISDKRTVNNVINILLPRARGELAELKRLDNELGIFTEDIKEVNLIISNIENRLLLVTATD